MRKIILFLLPLLLLTGCYNYRELTDLAIVSGISVSIVNHQYQVMVEVVNPKKQQDTSSSEEADFIIYKKKDVSLQEAFRKVMEESPKKLYGANMNLLIIDENILQEQLPFILDFFARSKEFRGEFYVLIGKGDDILSITTPLENLSSKSIIDSLKANHDFLGYANLVSFHDLLSVYLNPYRELAIPAIRSVGDIEKGDDIKNLEDTERKAYHIIDEVGIFRDNKIVGYLSGIDALTYNLVVGNANRFLAKNTYQNDGYVVCEVSGVHTDIDVNVINRKITITFSGEASLREETVPFNMEDVSVIEKIQNDLNQKIEDMVHHSITHTISLYHTDIYGFHNAFYLKSPGVMKELKDNWNDKVLDTLDIEIVSHIKITGKGNLNGGLYYE